MSHVFYQLYYHFAWATHSREPLKKDMEFLPCAKMRSRKFRDTLIAKKIIIGEEHCLSCWRDMNLKKMIGLKAL